jgi:hypothetical protein
VIGAIRPLPDGALISSSSTGFISTMQRASKKARPHLLLWTMAMAAVIAAADEPDDAGALATSQPPGEVASPTLNSSTDGMLLCTVQWAHPGQAANWTSADWIGRKPPCRGDVVELPPPPAVSGAYLVTLVGKARRRLSF